MYYNYDEYMREVLGYPATNPQNLERRAEKEPYQASVTYREEEFSRTNLENCYPDIYRMLMPMIHKACENLYDPVTEDDISRMALEIYFNFEVDEKREEKEAENRITETKQTNRNPVVRANGTRFDRNLEKSIQAKPVLKEVEKEEDREEERLESRRPNNTTLLDLIKILILNQILGRPRPPMPPRPPVRPPIRPREEYGEYGNYPYWPY